MKLADRGSLLSPLFSVELHSSEPGRMVAFYQEMLSLQFKAVTYPYTCYIARLGPLALIVSGSVGHDGCTASEPGKCTFGILTEAKETPEGERYFLYPKRPIGRAWPKQYASRIRDPEGNYLALASSMEDVMGRIPPIRSFTELMDCVLECALVFVERMRKRVRKAVDHVIDYCEHATNQVTFVRRDIGTHTHIVASREGLYLVDPSSYKRILRGSFFGTTIKDGAIYCFQSCGGSKGDRNKGRILKLTLINNRIEKVRVIAKGLDDGCHQMDFIGDDLLIVDCYNGRILQITPGLAEPIAHYPLGQLTRDVATDKYHINSLAGHPDGTVWLLLHNHADMPSEVVILSRQFEIIKRFFVKAGGAHNIVFTTDSLEYLIGDSFGARVISSQGIVVEGDMMRPRGISLDEHTCVIGDSFFCDRPFRRYVPGRVHFFDRASWTCISSLTLPAAPTDIRRIDGRDLSITNYLISYAHTAAQIESTLNVARSA